MSKVRVGIIGVGNCASSLVQGVTYYRNADSHERVPGLMQEAEEEFKPSSQAKVRREH